MNRKNFHLWRQIDNSCYRKNKTKKPEMEKQIKAAKKRNKNLHADRDIF